MQKHFKWPISFMLLLSFFNIINCHQTLDHQSQSIHNDVIRKPLFRIIDSVDYLSIYSSHQLQQEITTNSSTTTNSTTDPLNGCNTILLNLGDFSRYGPNATVIYGICPETWLSVSFSITIMFFYSILFLMTCFGLWWKRNSRHIQSRGLVYMFLTLFASAFIVFSSSLRYSIGRREYPCLIYTITYFVLPSSLILPAIFRCYRLVMLHLLNVRKMKMLIGGGGMDKEDLSLKSLAHKITKKGNDERSCRKVEKMKTVVELITMENIEDVTSLSNDETSRASSPVSNTSVESSSDVNYRQLHSPRVFFKKKSSDHSVKMIDFDNFHNDDEVKSNSDENSTIREDFDVNMKRAKILNFLVSNMFIVMTYFIIFSLHAILFLILGGIEWDQKLKKGTTIFTNDGGLFTVERGCGITNATFFLVGTETVFYIVIEVILIIFCIIADRDTWNMRKEALVLIVFKLLAIVIFVSFGFIPIFSKFLDFFIPFGNVLLFYSILDVVISITLPIVYAWISDKKRVEWNQDSGLEQCLTNKKTFEILLDFSRRSYCPEPILCYQDIERLNKSRPKNRKKLATHIQQTYLRKGSPLELNHPNLDEVYNEAKELIDSNVDVLPFFRKIQLHCLHDMIDIFERVKKQEPEVKKIVEEWKALHLVTTNINSRTTAVDFQSTNV